MDPITTAIIAALSVGVTSGLTDISKKAIADAYEQLKSKLREKYGKSSDVVKAVKSLEKKPDSSGRIEVLREELAAANAIKDKELLQAAQLLAALLYKPTEKKNITQKAEGKNIAQAADNSTATVNK